MKKGMLGICVVLLMALAVLLPILFMTGDGAIEIVTITVGVTLYHFAMRLTVGTIVNGIMKNRADPRGAWFRERRFERALYRGLGVRRWKKYLPTYDKDAFDTRTKTVRQIVGATCQAEVVHEIIMVLSLLPIAFAPILGGAAALIVTSVLAMLVDSLFVVLQRYNRPKLVRVMERFDTLKFSIPQKTDRL